MPRPGPAAAPSWLHNPERAATLLRRFTFEKVCPVGQSNHYKERRLRYEMWNHMLGEGP